MVRLHNYEAFITRVEALGFMPLSNILKGLPSVSSETDEGVWHTGDMDTDPWRWKDRVAAEKRLAFGCILGGHKGFVAPRMYACFFAAYHPNMSMEERWEAGLVSQAAWRIWKLFEEKKLLSTSDIRQAMGVTGKKGGSQVDSAIKEFQQNYYLTMAGNRQKMDKYGLYYGWPANVYEKVTRWIPSVWLEESTDYEPKEARNIIVETGLSMIGEDIDRKQLAKVLHLPFE